MSLEEFIETIEEDYLQEALEKLTKSPKDLISVYLNAKEYQRAKLMRSNFIPNSEEEDREFIITIKEPEEGAV